MLSEVLIINKRDIPALHGVEQNGTQQSLGELRDFARHPILKEHIPENARLAISWAHVAPGQVLESHVHPILSMIVVYGGSGRIFGDKNTDLKEGDIVLIGAGCLHGFVGHEPEGLKALTIQFEGGLYRDLERPLVSFRSHGQSLQSLLSYNASRMAEFDRSPFISMLESAALEDSARRDRLLGYIHEFSKHFQTIMYARQAACVDQRYFEPFLQHLREEVGHDELLAHQRESSEVPWDPVLESIGAWFISRMHVLDNCEKAAVVHLVLERAGARFHEVGARAMARFGRSPYFEAHHDADDGHADMGVELLHDLSPQTYDRLLVVVGQAWDVLLTMVGRITELVLEAKPTNGGRANVGSPPRAEGTSPDAPGA